MPWIRALAFTAVFLLAASAAAAAGEPLAAWAQLGPGGALIARVVTRGACPVLRVDGGTIPTRERAAPNVAFDVRVCAAAIPRSARRAQIAGRELPLLRAHVRHVAVLGDTGCRILLPFLQACNDPVAWPFAGMAREIARAKPDLIVHVGDYYYRETACPLAECSNSPHGDAWATWDADWFTPAQPLFLAAPILFTRGNHEVCSRGGQGWDRFLDVYPFGSCLDFEPAWIAQAGGLRLFVIDSANANDDRPVPAQVAQLAPQFAKLRALAPSPTWVISHRPLWGLEGTLLGASVPLNATLQAAVGDATTLPAALIVSGHIHLFEALRFADGRAPQVMVGTSGDMLSPLPVRPLGVAIDGTTIVEATIRSEFGYAIFDLDEKTFAVYDRTGAQTHTCRYGRGTVTCRAGS